MIVQQRLVAGRVGELHVGQPCAQGVGRQVVQGMAVDLCEAGAQVAAHEVFVAFELGLDDNEGKIGLGVHVARELFDFFDLLLDGRVDALEEPVGWPAVGGGEGRVSEGLQ